MLGASTQVIIGNNPQYQVRMFWNSNNFTQEGSAAFFYVTTQNVPQNTVVYWEIIGTDTGIPGFNNPANSADFQAATGSLTLDWQYSNFGNTILQSNLVDGNTTQFSITPTADLTTEGGEGFYINIRTGSLSGPIVATGVPIRLQDNSTTPTPTYAVSAAGGATSVNEGSSLTFNVTTTSVANGTTLYWTVSNAVDFATSSGSFTITSNAGSFSVTPTADSTTEGAETFIASVRTVSTSGSIVATSASITINDTSVAALGPYSDVNAQYLRLALPFNSTTGLDDIAWRFTGSPNTAACSRTGPSSGAVVITTADSKYYGSSAFGNNAGDALAYTLPVNIVTGSAFVIEFWAKVNTTSSNNWIFGDGYSARELAIGPYNGGSLPTNLSIAVGNGRIGGVGTGWNHYSFSNTHWFFNGTLRGTANWGASGWSFNLIRVMQQEIGDPNDFRGWVNDFRVYIGATRSTSFTPPGQMIP